MRITAQRALVAFFLLLLLACAFVFWRPMFARLTYDFHALSENGQVLYETGAEDLAMLAAAELAGGMRVVEKLQYAPFKDHNAIRIYVFNGLEPRMYYRQAGLFVEYLREADLEAFKSALIQIENGSNFAESWRHSYGRTIFALWQNCQKSNAA